jgi:S1-C subfamily serine protease
MSLVSIYRELKKSIVAFIPRYSLFRGESPPKLEFPPIIGTGFIVHEDGLIATNAHVAHCFKKMFMPKEAPKEEWPVKVLLLILTDEGMVEVFLDVLGIFVPSQFTPGGIYYGPKEGPDLAFVQVKTRGLTPVVLDSSTPIEEGTEIGTAGFPMGTDMLTAPGWLHQITPTVQNGIIAAVHPFFSSTPHSYSINIMVQGGASGSPVFACDSGKVIGMIANAVYDRLPLGEKISYRVPINISYAVPSHYINHFMKKILTDQLDSLPPEIETLDQMLEKYEKTVITPGEGHPGTVRKVESETEKERISKVLKIDGID